MDVDLLLAQVIHQAKALGIPVSEKIHPQVTLNTRAVSRFGCCVRRGDRDFIEVSALLIEAVEEAVRETLAHEILHTCWGCRNHGVRWKTYAEKMNLAYGYHIARTSSWEGLGLKSPRPAKYVLVCQNCGVEISRARKSSLVKYPQRYRCRCGGQLLERK